MQYHQTTKPSFQERTGVITVKTSSPAQLTTIIYMSEYKHFGDFNTQWNTGKFQHLREMEPGNAFDVIKLSNMHLNGHESSDARHLEP